MSIDTSSNAWQGRLVRLRAFEPSDWEVYGAWNTDDEQARSVSGAPNFPQSADAVRQWAEHEATRARDGDGFRFVIENDAGAVVGDITTHHCNPRVGSFWYGISIHHEHRRNGYASEAITLVLRYFFQELRYQKATVGIYSFNQASMRLHEALGFQVEGRLRRTVYTRDQHFDEILYGITSEEFATSDRMLRLAGRDTQDA